MPEFTPAPIAQVSAPHEVSVDDLLLEDPFPSVRPGPSYSDVLEEEPIPLVSVASPRPIGQEDDVSGVVSISEFSEEQPEELLEDDIVEMTSSDAELPGANLELDELRFDDDDLRDKRAAPSDDEPPASSSRKPDRRHDGRSLGARGRADPAGRGPRGPAQNSAPRVRSPSSGRAARGHPRAAGAGPRRATRSRHSAHCRRARGAANGEQLGQTIDLEEARGPSLELDQPAFNADALQDDLPNEELEVTLPGREFAGGYQPDLMPPPERGRIWTHIGSAWGMIPHLRRPNRWGSIRRPSRKLRPAASRR
ncbi:MAG: hypothetical protein WDO74_34895 [Pseudomonadota bacterium]